MDDYLSIVLRENRSLFEKFYVITSPSDYATRELCKRFEVDIILYDEFYINNAKFNKSGAVNYAQKILHKLYPDKWMLIIDSDIILPINLKDIVELELENEKNIYGIQRFDAHTYKDYINESNLKKYMHNFAGYFQLYYDKSYFYNTFSNNASMCDFEFFKKFNKNKQLLSSYVIHLGEECLHWNGRNVLRLPIR